MMVSARSPHMGLWQEIASFVAPRRRFQGEGGEYQGVSLNDDAFRDTTLMRGLRTNASGQMEMIIPRAYMWFSFDPPERFKESEELKKRYKVLAILVATYMRASNLYTAAQGVLFDRSAFGVAALWSEWREKFRFRWIPVGTWMADLNCYGELRSFVEDRYLTIRDIFEVYPKGNMPEVLLETYRNKRDEETRHLVFQALTRIERGEKGYRNGKRWRLRSVHDGTGAILREVDFFSCPVTVCRYEEAANSSYGQGLGEMGLADQRELTEHIKKLSVLAEQKIFPPMLLPDGFVGDVGFGPGEITTFNPLNTDAIPRPLFTNAATGNETKWQVERLEKNIMSLCDVSLFAPLAGIDRPQDMKATVAGMLESYAARIAAPAYSRLVEEFLEPVVGRCLDMLITAGVVEKSFRGEDGRPGVKFINPFQTNLNRQTPQLLSEAINALLPLIQLDPMIANIFDTWLIAQDVCGDVGLNPKWIRSKADLDRMRKAQEQAQQVEQQKANAETANIMSGTQLNQAKAQSML